MLNFSKNTPSEVLKVSFTSLSVGDTFIEGQERGFENDQDYVYLKVNDKQVVVLNDDIGMYKNLILPAEGEFDIKSKSLVLVNLDVNVSM